MSSKRVTVNEILETFDAFDVFRRGELKSSICIDVATVFFHYLDCSPSAVFNADISASGVQMIERSECARVIHSHICNIASTSEAVNLYEVFTHEDQAGPIDSIEIVGSRFGPNANYGSHPDGQKLDPLLLSLASRCMHDKKTTKRVADAALFVQNSAGALFPKRKPQDSLSRDEWERVFVACAALAPAGGKRAVKQSKRDQQANEAKAQAQQEKTAPASEETKTTGAAADEL